LEAIHGFDCFFRQDNVLLEWTLIAELVESKQLRAVVPVLIGEIHSDAAGVETMRPLFASAAFSQLSAAVYARVNSRAAAILSNLGLAASDALHRRSVREVVERITGHLGIPAHERFAAAGGGGAGFGGGLHGREARMRELVKSVGKSLMRVLENLLRKEDGGGQGDAGLQPTAEPRSASLAPDQAVQAEAGAAARARAREEEEERSRLQAEIEQAKTLQAEMEAERRRMEAELNAKEAELQAKEEHARLQAELRAKEAELERERAKALQAQLEAERAKTESACCKIA
jgi:hypothetical protein